MKVRDKGPVKYSLVGQMQPQKGTVEGVKFVALDAIPDCDPEQCCALPWCHYRKKGTCSFRKIYLMNVINSYIDALESPTRLMLLRIGSLLVPLWDQLCRLKMEELAVSKVMTSSGIHSTHKAIRETVRTILKLEAELKLVRVKGKTEEDQNDRDPLLYGDADYYDSLTQEMDPDDI